MEVIRSVREMQELAEAERGRGHRIVLVPTMGYFHQGHLNLMKAGRSQGGALAVSIYVNPLQFAPTEDFASYPRDFERDKKMAEGVGVDWIFTPDHADMYPEGYQTHVEVEEVTNNLCGISRPHFFRGVTTVCAKLFCIVKPHVTIFGKKDYQQYIAIKRMVEDLNMDMQVVGVPTTREPDGLAMSSRNVYLKPEERVSALSLYRSLYQAKQLYESGERDADAILKSVRASIVSHPFTRIDYVQICDTATMKNVSRIEGKAVLAMAVWVGKTRLIDNHVFGEPLEI